MARVYIEKFVCEFDWWHYPKCFDEVAEKPLGKLIEKLKDVESKKQTSYLTDEDYNNLKKVKIWEIIGAIVAMLKMMVI